MTTGSIRIAMTSDVGLRRKNNEDTGFAQQGVFMVCDGMGGGMGGEQASQLAAQHFALGRPDTVTHPSGYRRHLGPGPARQIDLGRPPWRRGRHDLLRFDTAQDHADSTSARSAALFSDADDQDFWTRPMWSMLAIPAPTISVRWRMPMLPPRISFPCGCCS